MERTRKQMQKSGERAIGAAGHRDGTTHAGAVILCLLLLLPVAAVRAQSDGERAAKAGTLSTLKNLRVLRLSGGDVKERGFAHGYLLAADILDIFDAALGNLPNFNARRYETGLLPWSRKTFTWDADATAELDGIFAGMTAKLGPDGLQSSALNRALTREDLVAINVLADYFGPVCSAFAAWGKRTAGGEVLHARSLDFPLGPKIIASQIVVVSEGVPARGEDRPARQAWVAVTWPGLIGLYSGMNRAGLVVCIHDAYNLQKGVKDSGSISRGLLARRMLDEIDPAACDPAEKGAQMAAAHAAACGNMFQLTWPKAAAEKRSTTPSAVLEFDVADRTVGIRRMDESGVLVVTNHFRVRSKPAPCERYTKICEGLATLEQSGKLIGLLEARKLLMAAEQAIAAHSVYFYPDKLELHVALTRGNIMSPRVTPVALTFEELFARPK
ncbi:MAG: C45 family autoproteolytic acyltransferase/hydrolase [Planctomycetota bacterium]|nr:C45 family autoproteolytic acyltransferase/hydrolase [Planctomycetota bacterium]